MSDRQRMVKSTFWVTVVIVVSKLVGFIREAALAAQFGQGLEKSAYLTAYQVLSLFTVFFGVGIGSSFIPIYSRSRLQKGERSANDYSASVLNLYILLALLVSALGYLFAPQLAGLVWDGSAEGRELVTELTRVMMPSLVFWAVTGVLANLLNARKHFIPEQLTGFALSFCVILACILSNRIELVAVATAVSAVVQVFILLPFLKGRFKYVFKLDLKSPEIKQTFLLAIPAFISVAFDEINTVVDTRFASAMGDNVPSAINESYRLVQPVLGILVVPITTVMFTQLSNYAAENRMDELKHTVRKAVEVIALITIPVIVIALVLRVDVIGLFFERGNYTSADTAFTAPVFALYIIGIFGFGLRNFLTRVFYALQRTRIPMAIGIVAVGVNIFLDYVLKDPLGAKGLTLATSIAGAVGACAMIIVLHRILGRMNFSQSVGQLLRIAVCSAACAAVVFCVEAVLPLEGGAFASRLVRIAVCGGAGLAAYAVLAYALRVDTAWKLMDMLKGKLRRKKAA